jgi:hypothetical protein
VVESTVWFSLSQLAGKDGGCAVHVRSIRDNVKGHALDDLVAQICRRSTDDSEFRYKLALAGYRSGGSRPLRLRVDETRAVRLEHVPRPIVKDERISNVRFEVDFDALSDSYVDISKLLEDIASG